MALLQWCKKPVRNLSSMTEKDVFLAYYKRIYKTYLICHSKTWTVRIPSVLLFRHILPFYDVFSRTSSSCIEDVKYNLFLLQPTDVLKICFIYVLHDVDQTIKKYILYLENNVVCSTSEWHIRSHKTLHSNAMMKIRLWVT